MSKKTIIITIALVIVIASVSTTYFLMRNKQKANTQTQETIETHSQPQETESNDSNTNKQANSPEAETCSYQVTYNNKDNICSVSYSHCINGVCNAPLETINCHETKEICGQEITCTCSDKDNTGLISVNMSQNAQPNKKPTKGISFEIGNYTVSMNQPPQDWLMNAKADQNWGMDVTFSKKYCDNGTCLIYNIIGFSTKPTKISYDEQPAKENDTPFITIGNKKYKTTEYVMAEGGFSGSSSHGNYLVELDKNLYVSLVFGSELQYKQICMKECPNLDEESGIKCIEKENCTDEDTITKYDVGVPQEDLEQAKELIKSISWEKK